MVAAMQDLLWRVTASVPFDWKWSKNRMWLAIAGSYARRLAPHARARRDDLAMLLRVQLAKSTYRVANNKLRFGIHVTMPDHRGDAINCLDLVADGIECATELNDRWFELASLTWSFDPTDPHLEVWIGQESDIDVQFCGGVCAELLTLEHFNKGRNQFGKCTVCRACQAAQRCARKADLEHRSKPPMPEPEPDGRSTAPWLA